MKTKAESQWPILFPDAARPEGVEEGEEILSRSVIHESGEPDCSRAAVPGLAALARGLLLYGLLAGLTGAMGCGTGRGASQNTSFFTSGSKEADQRAGQRMAKAEQLSGSGEQSGESGVKKPNKSSSSTAIPQAAQATQKTSLYERLGGEQGLTAIVADFMPRVLQDPRVNFARKGVKAGGLFHHGPAVTWNANQQNIAMLEKHFVEFLALATGGPAHYQGKEIKSDHGSMNISNPEFDAAVGDIKASLDKLQIPNQEQKELLAIVESTRPEIVTVR